MARHVVKLWWTVTAIVFLASACSPTRVTAADSPLFDEEANAPIEQIDEGSGGVASGPIEDLLTVQLSFGFGAFAVDATTGEAAAIPGIAAVETVERDNDVIVSGDAAFALGSKLRDGQTFSSDFSIVKIEYDTGQARQLAALGPNRDSDEDQELTTHRLVAVAGDSVVASSGQFGEDPTYTTYDASTGAETGSFDEPEYSFEGDGGSCSGGASNMVGLSDGRLAAVVLGSPAIIDVENGDIELMIGCDEEEPELIDFVAVADINDYAVYSVGSSPNPDQVERLLQTDLVPSSGFAEGDGDLWWISSAVRSVDDVNVMVGGVVQFDLTSETVEAVHPLGVHLGRYLECEPEGDSCSVETIEQAQMRYIDGRLVIVDVNENGKLLILDPATGDLTATTIDPKGVDYTTADLLSGDRNAVWIQVRRMTIISDDDSGRTATGDSYIERVDTATGQIELSLLGEDLFS